MAISQCLRTLGAQSTWLGVKQKCCRPRGTQDEFLAAFALKLSLLNTYTLTRHSRYSLVRLSPWPDIVGIGRYIHLQSCYVKFRVHTACDPSCLADRHCCYRTELINSMTLFSFLFSYYESETLYYSSL